MKLEDSYSGVAHHLRLYAQDLLRQADFLEAQGKALKESRARSLAEDANSVGRQRPSKSHDAGSNPVEHATFAECPACAGAPGASHVPPCSAEGKTEKQP